MLRFAGLSAGSREPSMITRPNVKPDKRRRRGPTPRGGLVGVVVVAVLIVLAASAGATSNKDTSQTVAAVKSLLRGIPQERERLGKRDAPVTLRIFGDLECPACRYLTLNILPTLIKEFVRPGELKLEYHSFESYTLEQAVFEKQQIAALAAGQQNKMWYYIELFYHEPASERTTNWANESYLDGLARQVPGLNLAKWMAALFQTSLADQVGSDAVIGTRFGWQSTPDFLLGNGTSLHPYYPVNGTPGAFAKAIRALLAHHSRPG
jgi:protein-disulfide isomerase